MSRIEIEMLLKNQIESLKLQNKRERAQYKHDIREQRKVIRRLKKEANRLNSLLSQSQTAFP